MFSLANEYEQLGLMGKVSEFIKLPTNKPSKFLVTIQSSTQKMAYPTGHLLENRKRKAPVSVQY